MMNWGLLRRAAHAEVGRWRARPIAEILAQFPTKNTGPACYSTEFESHSIGVVLTLLSAGPELIELLLEVQPNDPADIDAISAPRAPGAGGWSDEELGLVSEYFCIARG